MAGWVEGASQFGKGFGQGVWNFAKDTVSGVADLGKAGYQLATDGAYREQAYEAAKGTAQRAASGIGAAIDDPAGAMNGIRDRASAAWDAYQAERAKAAAEGRLAEFDGQMAGRGLSEIASLLVPVSKVGKLGKLGDLAGDAQKLDKAADALKAEAAAVKVMQDAKALPDRPPSAKQPCPKAGEAKKPAPKAGEAKKPAPKASAEPGENPAGQKSNICSSTETGGCPISMVTGEELLALDDFAFSGPVSLTWTRFYRTSQSAADLQLGHGWLTPLDEWLEVGETDVVFHDREGRTVKLPLAEPDSFSINLPEKLRLYREAGRFRLVAESGPDRVFHGESGRCRLHRWQNESGQFVEAVYDEQDRVHLLQSSWGKTLMIQHSGGHIAAVVPARAGQNGIEPAAAPLVRYQYDAAGDLVAVLDRLDQGERYAYRDHVITRRTLASGFSFHFEWDRYTPQGRCVRNFGDNGIYDYRFEWTDSGISRAIDSRGGVTEYMHDTQARLVWKISPEGRATHYAYDANNLLAAITDGAGNTTRYEYDEDGRLTAVTDPLRQTYRLAYDGAGRPTTLTDPLGQTWTRVYDGQGRLVETLDPQGGATRFGYNEQGLPSAVINAMRQTRTLLWDEQARLVGDIGFDGIRRHFKYDAEDRITAVVTQDQRTRQYQYDAAGRVTAVKGADGAVVKLKYNAFGLLTHYTDPAGRTTEYRYGDGLTHVTERIDPAGQVLRYQYDSERNLIGLINAKGESYRLNYDLDENLIEEIGFDGRIQRYRYDSLGRLDAYAQRGDAALGQADWLLTRFNRDPLGRLLQKTAPDGAETAFGYDPLGRLRYAKNPHSELHFHYNPLGQIVEDVQGDVAVKHDYDALGRRTLTVAPDGQRIEYGYDQHGWLERIMLNGEPLSRHRYDELGQEIARQQGDLVSRYDYDPAGRLKQHQAGFSGNKTAVLGRRFGYDPTGKLNAVDDFRQGHTHYVYDPADRLVEVEGLHPERFVHDPAGNLIGVNQENGGRVEGDRLMMMGDRHFQYDAAGNLIEERRGKGGALVTRFAYDGDNRLIRAENAKGVSRYQYDPLGRRIAKQTPEGETRFVYDGARLLTEIKGAQQRTYVFEPGGFRPLACIDRLQGHGDAAVYYYQLDHLGTPRELTNARGQIVWSGQYRAYGSLALADIAEVDNPLRFQGQYFDVETGLHYNLNRYYDPTLGRFISQDPIGLAGGQNLFQYAPNPVNWVDPLGLSCKQNSWNEFQKAHKGQFDNPTDSAAAYNDLVAKQSPWPIGFDPPHATVLPGTKVNMAMSPGQTSLRPGGFGTFDDIPNVDYVRNELAVKEAWKPSIDRVVTYEVTKPLPVRIGPVGPQIDKGVGSYLKGGGSQIEMLVSPADRMNYLKVVGEQPIN